MLAESSEELPVLLKEIPFGKCLSLLRKSVGCDGERSKYLDLLTVSVLNGARPINEIIYLKKTDIDRLEPMSRKIIEQNSDPNREYVFDLRQSYHTPRQIYSSVTDGIREVFEGKVSVPGMDADKMACSLWAACAMRSGASASEALAMTEGVAPYSVPAFCEPASIGAVDKAEWIKPVNQLLASDLLRWFAMHLRKGVSFDSLRREISEKIRPIPELFYPCETITKFVGNKKTVTDHPVISQTAFFKSHPENVMPMCQLPRKSD